MTSPSLRRTAVVVAILATLGFVANLATLWVGYGISLIFGSIAAMVVTVLFGAGWGVASSLVISSATWAIWYHPYAILILTAEVAFVGVMLARGRRNIVLVDTVYWLVLGMPLVFVCYHGAMGINLPHTLAIALKQTLNGILNALMASIVVSHLPIRRWLRLGDERVLVSYAQIIFHATSVIVLLSSLSILLLTSYRQVDRMQEAAIAQLRAESTQLAALLDDWMRLRLRAVEEVAGSAKRFGLRPSEVLQETLRRTVRLFPDFQNAYVAGPDGKTVAFYPETNELGQPTIGLDFSDRRYFAELQRTLRPFISDVFQGRGGVFVPIFTISSPLVVDGRFGGFALAAVDPDRLVRIVAPQDLSQYSVTIVDDDGHVVLSTDPRRRPMERFSRRQAGVTSEVAPGVMLFVPGVGSNSSIMEKWQGAFFFTRTRVAEGKWELLVEYPVAPLQDVMFASTTFNLELLLGAFLLGLLLSHLLGKGLASTPSVVARISRAVPDKLRATGEIEWPRSDIAEMEAFIENFKETAAELGARMHEVEDSNLVLEQRVRERTEALQSLTENLERRVEEHIALRAKDEQMLVHQSKMAAMGEMLGAIAHQWRQPLNTLGLCMQNIEASWDAGEMNDEALHAAVERGMRQIRHMSKTIDDFRNFFTSDRERVVFDIGQTTAEVLALFSAQLQANHIELEVVCLDHQARAETLQTLPCSHAWTVLGVPGEFEHVVLNLLSNAKDAIVEGRRQGQEGGGRIEFALSSADGRIQLRIADDGIGLTPDVARRMFEPYFTTKQESKGTGMGLYISKVIVEDHLMGAMWAESTGRGSTVVISLPATARGSSDKEGSSEEVGRA